MFYDIKQQRIYTAILPTGVIIEQRDIFFNVPQGRLKVGVFYTEATGREDLLQNFIFSLPPSTSNRWSAPGGYFGVKRIRMAVGNPRKLP